MSSLESTGRIGTPKDIGALQSASPADWPWGPEPAAQPTKGRRFQLDTATKEKIVAEGFANALQADPSLLNRTIADASRFINVPPGALDSAFNKLVAQTDGNVKLSDANGEPRSMGDILRSLPQEQASAIVTQWFKSLPPAVQQVMAGVATGLVLATEGPRGLAQRLRLALELVKSPNGKLELSLLPDAKNGVLGNASGELRIPLDGNGQISLAGSVRTDAQAQFSAGLRLALGASTFTLNGTLDTQKPGALDAGLLMPVGGDTQLKLGVAVGEKPINFSAALGGKSWSVQGSTNERESRLEGQLRLSL
jgi:hypothetical protein